MKNPRLLSLLFGLLASISTFVPASVSAAGCGGHGDAGSMVVSTDWLATHLHDSNLVILSVGDKKDYDEGHIPGTLWVDYMATHLMESHGLSLEMPPMSQLVEVFGKLGVNNDSHIVLYQSKDWLSPTARVYLTLDVMGLGRQTSILNGGMLAWRAENRPVETETRAVTPGTISPCPQDDVITDLSYVSANLHHPGVKIIDARLSNYYTGETQPDGQRSGHIPGAANIPYTSVVDDKGKLLPAGALQSLFRNAGATPGDRVVSYCHVGQQASAIYFVARYLGFDARMYDGSWEEWSAHKDLPAELSPDKAAKK